MAKTTKSDKLAEEIMKKETKNPFGKNFKRNIEITGKDGTEMEDYQKLGMGFRDDIDAQARGAYLSMVSDDTSDASDAEYNAFDQDNYPSSTLNTTDLVPARGISLDKSTGLFTVTNGGVYDIQAILIVIHSVANVGIFTIKINGVTEINPTMYVHSSVDPAGMPLHIKKVLVAGDTISFHVDGTGTFIMQPGTTVNIERIATL